MYHKPVCVKCEVELKLVTNGIIVCDTTSNGPYKLWNADKYKCPKCGAEIIVGFAESAYYEHYDEGFQKHIAIIPKSNLVQCYES
jgi:predicted RNA-binding Zn-ribbon protein involved in translation (DUF1610 family)